MVTLEDFMGTHLKDGFTITWLADGLWLLEHTDGRTILVAHDAASNTFTTLEGTSVSDTETTTG